MQEVFSELSPRDPLMVTAATFYSDLDQQVLTYLYQPLLGPVAYSLANFLWTEVQQEDKAAHRHDLILTTLNIDLPTFYQARLKLEALGLVKTYWAKAADPSYYVYELYAPQPPTRFFQDDLLSVLLYETVGEQRFQQLVTQFKRRPVTKASLVDVSHNFLDVFHIDPQHVATTPAAIAEANEQFQVKTAPQPQITAHSQFDWPFFKQQLQRNFVALAPVVKQRQLILTFHELYGLNELELAQLVADSVDLATDQFDVVAFKHLVLAQYQGQTKITTQQVAETPPAQAPVTDFSKADQQLIQVSRQYAPYEFLQQLKQQQGTYVTQGEQRLLERLVARQLFPNSVINIMIHYMLSVRQMPTLNQNFLDTLANSWAKAKITTPEAAMTEVKAHYQPKTPPTKKSGAKPLAQYKKKVCQIGRKLIIKHNLKSCHHLMNRLYKRA